MNIDNAAVLKTPGLDPEAFTADNVLKKAKGALYTVGEERFNAASHFVGAVFSLFFAGWTLGGAVLSGDIMKIISAAVYSVSMILLYTASCAYHSLPAASKAKNILRIADHCTIFLLIAGCYTPFCLTLLRDLPAARLILLCEWSMAAAGIILNIINMHAKPVKAISQLSYPVMGWMIVPVMGEFLRRASALCFSMLLTGGLCYTVGIIFYALGKKMRYMHGVWHIFVLLGSVFQFVSMACILR